MYSRCRRRWPSRPREGQRGGGWSIQETRGRCRRLVGCWGCSGFRTRWGRASRRPCTFVHSRQARSRGHGCPPCGCRSSRHGIGHAHRPSTASSGRQRPGGSWGASCFWRQECPQHVHVARPFDRRSSSLQDCQVNDTGQWSLPKTSLWISACCTWGMARSLTSM